MTDIERIDIMIRILRDLKQDKARLAKLSAMNLMEMTQKQAQKRNADAGWIGMANIKRLHELHALAVEIGFAERRDSYDPFELTDGWQRYTHKPREPS